MKKWIEKFTMDGLIRLHMDGVVVIHTPENGGLPEVLNSEEAKKVLDKYQKEQNEITR